MQKLTNEILDSYFLSDTYRDIVYKSGMDRNLIDVLDQIEKVVGKETFDIIEPLISDVVVKREEFGFLNGSKYFMMLISEIAPEVTKQKVGDVA